MTRAGFIFAESIPEWVEGARYVGHVRSGHASKRDLFSDISAAFKFPDYFGYNWNALIECLSDLEWIRPVDHVVVNHHGLPLAPGSDLEHYIGCLAACCRRSLECNDTSFWPLFPSVTRPTIETILRANCEDRWLL